MSRTLLRVLSVFSLLALVGCGSDSSSPQPTAQVQPSSTPSAPSSPAAMPAGEDEAMNMESEMAMMDPAMMDPTMMEGMPGAQGPGGAGPALPSRPEELEEWTSQDITTALEERDPKTLQVLPIYAERRKGDDAAAQEVVAWMGILMEPPKEAPQRTPAGYPGEMSNPDSISYDAAMADAAMAEEMSAEMAMEEGGNVNTPQKAGSAPEFAEALIDTLLSLQTLTSYQAARDLLEGLIPLPLDQEQIARQTLTSLIQNIQSLHDPAAKILKQSITQPVSILDSQGDFDTQKMQKVSSEEHWKNALALVDGLMGVTTNEKSRKPQGGDPYGESMMMEAEMFGGGRSAAADQRQNELNTETINPIPPKLQLKDFSQERAEFAKNYLWSEEMVDNLTAQLSANENLLRNPELFMLAGQIPATSSRFALKNFLEQNWTSSDEPSRNPVGLVRHDVFNKYMRDPGLLISLKAIPREQNTAGATNEAAAEFGGTEGRREAGDDRDSEANDKGMWYQASEQLMLTWLDKMHEASSQQTLPDFNPDELDIRMHRGATATLSARLLLDRGIRSENPEEELFDKTTVNYVRIESSQMDDRTVKHYRSAIKGEKVFAILNNNGMWMESSGRDRGTNELYSIDILLSRNNARKSLRPQARNQNSGFAEAAPEEYGEAGGNQTFVVEILTIRIPDPEVFLVPEAEETTEVSSRQ